MKSWNGTNRMRPEIDLLLLCARIHLTRLQSDRILALVGSPLDWDYLLRLATRHRLRSLLYWHLSQICPQEVPESVLSDLRATFQRTATRNLFLTWQLLELLDAFKADGIAAIPFKGPVLAASLYNNVALRPFDDLDLFVHRADISRVREILAHRGFQPLYDLTALQDANYQDSNCELCFVNERGRVAVDLHWGIAPDYFAVPFEPQDWWDRASNVMLGDREVHSLSPEDLLLYLCVHGTKHTWERLLWLTDVFELIQAYPALHYDDVFERAAGMHSTRMLLLGLALSRDLLGAVLPEPVEDRLARDRAIPSLVARITQNLGGDREGHADMVSASTFRLKARERFIDQAAYCLKLATTPTINDWAWVSLPRVLFPLYYVLRPLRLVIQRGLGSTLRCIARTSA